ncbi:helix-turn-helix transcriptional regulator [Oxalobacteraceae bacterium]|nr:helix-turn-helix transcriptional regulator [Oxalobacteraceae bacterium]
MNSISKLRARLAVTQSAMADAIGVSQGNVSNYERGQTVPPDVAKRLIEYSATFGVGISYNDIYGAAEEVGVESQADHRSATPKPSPLGGGDVANARNLGHCGRQPASPKNIFDSVPDHAVVGVECPLSK